MAPDLPTILPHVITACREAGDKIAAEFARPEGPRFSDHITAPLDTEIEMMLRDRLLTLVPARFVGEEACILEAPAHGFCWVVDPHDGTRAFLEGKRGSAVSVALLRRGIPILAVVYAPTCPDRGPDMIAWHEGGPITRGGQIVTVDLSNQDLAPGAVVFLNHGAWQRPVWHAQACAPAGFMPLPSIAYRLARIAVGDGIATQTLRPVNALDIAAGHALVMAAGGVLTREDGCPVTYDEQGHSRPSACFGGAPRAVEALRARTWRGSQEPRREPRITLPWPRRVPEAMLDRAAGTLFGLAIGDDLGPGMELALIVARALVDEKTYNKAKVQSALSLWAKDLGGRPRDASPYARAIPIGLWARTPEEAEAAALADSPNVPGVPEIAVAISLGVQGGKPEDLAKLLMKSGHHDFGMSVRNGSGWTSAISGALVGAAHGRCVFPAAQVMRVLTRRPDEGLGVANPRPEICWADDLVDLAEALLSQGQR